MERSQTFASNQAINNDQIHKKFEDKDIFAEFKNKYKRSLEALSSLKEIMDLKQNSRHIKHTYKFVTFLKNNGYII